MPEEDKTRSERMPPWVVGWGAGLLGGIAIAILSLVLLFWLAPGTRITDLLGAVLGDSPTRVELDQPTVVRQVQQLRRLETVIYRMDKVVAGGRDHPYLPPVLAGEKLLLMVHGEVVAGVDLGRIGPDDVRITGNTVEIKLPPPEIFSARLDSARTRVYSRDTGLFSRTDPNLETLVRREAERDLRDAAMKDGILKAAGRNAATTLVSLLRGLGFENVVIR
ncbi:MAG: DUF4230 domain-containing protein [Terriglobales bacterium]